MKAKFETIHLVKDQILPDFLKTMIDNGTLLKVEGENVDSSVVDSYKVAEGESVKLFEVKNYHVAINDKLITLDKVKYFITITPVR